MMSQYRLQTLENDNVVSPVDEPTVVVETPESDGKEEEVADHGEGHITKGSDG